MSLKVKNKIFFLFTVFTISSGPTELCWGFTSFWGRRKWLSWLAAQQIWIQAHSALAKNYIDKDISLAKIYIDREGKMQNFIFIFIENVNYWGSLCIHIPDIEGQFQVSLFTITFSAKEIAE